MLVTMSLWTPFKTYSLCKLKHKLKPENMRGREILLLVNYGSTSTCKSSSFSNIIQASKEYHVQAQCNTLNDSVGINIVLWRNLFLQCPLMAYGTRNRLPRMFIVGSRMTVGMATSLYTIRYIMTALACILRCCRLSQPSWFIIALTLLVGLYSPQTNLAALRCTLFNWWRVRGAVCKGTRPVIRRTLVQAPLEALLIDWLSHNGLFA